VGRGKEKEKKKGEEGAAFFVFLSSLIHASPRDSRGMKKRIGVALARREGGKRKKKKKKKKKKKQKPSRVGPPPAVAKIWERAPPRPVTAAGSRGKKKGEKKKKKGGGGDTAEPLRARSRPHEGESVRSASKKRSRFLAVADCIDRRKERKRKRSRGRRRRSPSSFLIVDDVSTRSVPQCQGGPSIIRDPSGRLELGVKGKGRKRKKKKDRKTQKRRAS